MNRPFLSPLLWSRLTAFLRFRLMVETHRFFRFPIKVGTIRKKLGASLKDLGKKWYAFNKMEIDTESLIKKL